MDHWIGVDLGSHVDFTAVAVLARSLAIKPDGLPARSSRGDTLHDWRLRALKRFGLRTSYELIARSVADIALMPDLGAAPRVVVDGTGVGVAIVELIRGALARYPEIEVWSCSVTSGESWRVVRRGEINVSKIQLVSSFAAALHSGRFRVSHKPDGTPIDGADVLERELAAFKVKQSRRSDAELFGADQGKHDDAVACCSMPVFLGGLRRFELVVDDFKAMRPREVTAVGLEASEEERIEAAEREALATERGELTPMRQAHIAAIYADPFSRLRPRR